MKTLLICHQDSALDSEVLPRWLSSFSELSGIVALKEPKGRRVDRIKREIRRNGLFRFVEVVAFRLYHRLRLAPGEQAWESAERRRLLELYPEPDEAVPVLVTASPNTDEAERFIRSASPDVVVARCRTLIDERIFTIPATGTFVMHPGITPEYRNSHGCFWALANRDLERVGMTLLKIDAGVDTGPVYGYFTYAFDERRESHIVIQKRMVLENLDAVRDRLVAVERGEAKPIPTDGRSSSAWGQPWLSKYVRWKLAARRAG
jgi:hypothetical protein